MIQDVFIIGANGNVGSKLVRQIFEKGDTDPDLHENPTRVVGLSSISSIIYDPHGLSKKRCYEFSNSRDNESRYALNDLLEIVRKNPSDGKLTFVDVTTSREPMRDFHLQVIHKTPYGIVTSNKNPITMVDSESFRDLVKHTKRYGFRCSVMAGANAIDEIKDFMDLGDHVRRIRGCFSGTLGYICSGLQLGRPFSGIVKEAKERGYTEPHPAEDLSGIDASKKILILARTAGITVDMGDVLITPFIEEEFLKERDVEKFMTRLPELDERFLRETNALEARGEVLRYVAQLSYDGKKPLLTVGPSRELKDSQLGILNKTANKIVIHTDIYTSENPCIIEAPGAGLELTAQNVRRDLLQQIRERTINYSNGS